jgi:putative transposase
MTRYIDTHRDRFGVEPICRAVQVAPSTYYATKRRPPSARAVRDAELAPKIQQVFDDNYQVYGSASSGASSSARASVSAVTRSPG